MNPQIPTASAPSTVSTITDPVTKQSFSRDTSVAGSTYQPVTATPSAPTAPSTPASPEDTIAQGYGFKDYNDAISQLTAPPTDNETDLYNKAYSAAGLDQLANAISEKQNALNQATYAVNDNPWLDEASRVGKVRNLTSLATGDIKNLQDEYKSKLASVKNLVSQETGDNTATANANKAKLAALEAQAKAAATAATKTATPPKTIKSASGATYQWNPATGKFDQIFSGKTAKASASSTKGVNPPNSAINSIQSTMNSITGGVNHGTSKDDGKISPDDWANALNEWMSAGYSEASFMSNFKSYANTSDKSQHYVGLN